MTDSIIDSVTMYELDNETITDADRAALTKMGYDIDDPDLIVSQADLEQLPGYFDELRYEYAYFDDDGYVLLLDDYLKDAEQYLICVGQARWDGAAGYKIVSDKKDILRREYDTDQFHTKSTHRRKAMTWTEASHDVPMGSSAVAIALTKNEAKRIQNALDAENFKAVNAFVSKYI